MNLLISNNDRLTDENRSLNCVPIIFYFHDSQIYSKLSANDVQHLILKSQQRVGKTTLKNPKPSEVGCRTLYKRSVYDSPSRVIVLVWELFTLVEWSFRTRMLNNSLSSRTYQFGLNCCAWVAVTFDGAPDKWVEEIQFNKTSD